MSTTIKLRRGTSTAFSTNNPTLQAGEPAFETDTGKLKIGDGATLYNSLAYIGTITSGDVTTALGYTPYDSSNPSGYTTNIGTVTSVNNTQPDSNGNVTISIPQPQSEIDDTTVSTSTAYSSSKSNSTYISSSTVRNIATLTQQQYDDIATPDSNTEYHITDAIALANVDLSNTSDTGYIKMAGAGMPSDTYEDLTLGASGSTYTAPADGWFYINKSAVDSGKYIVLENTSNNMQSGLIAGVGGQTRASLPVHKGDIIAVTYSLTGATNVFRFIYAVGSESEYTPVNNS